MSETEHILMFVGLQDMKDSLVAQLVKNPPAMQETPGQFLGWEDPLEKVQATALVFLGFPGGSAGKKNPPTMRETWDRSLGCEHTLEK